MLSSTVLVLVPEGHLKHQISDAYILYLYIFMQYLIFIYANFKYIHQAKYSHVAYMHNKSSRSCFAYVCMHAHFYKGYHP